MGCFELKFVKIDHQWVDIFTKTLLLEHHNFIQENLNRIDFTCHLTI